VVVIGVDVVMVREVARVACRTVIAGKRVACDQKARAGLNLPPCCFLLHMTRIPHAFEGWG